MLFILKNMAVSLVRPITAVEGFGDISGKFCFLFSIKKCKKKNPNNILKNFLDEL